MARDEAPTKPNRPTRTGPVKAWAGVGILFLALQGWVLGRWTADGNLRVTVNTDVEISQIRAALICAGAALDVALLIIVTVVIARGCRRAGRVTFDAALATGYALSAWQDPLYDYFGSFALHNQYAPHFPSWGSYVPGRTGHPDPGLEIETAIGLAGVGGFAAMIVCVWTQCWLVEQVAQRRPHWDPTRMLLVGIVAGLVTVCSVEALAIGSGTYSWAGAVRPLSLWGGHWYQYPLYECLAWTALLTIPAMMRYTSRAHGTTPHILRGADPIDSPAGPGTRLLAGIGFANTITLGYMAVNATATLWSSPAPIDTPDFFWPR